MHRWGVAAGARRERDAPSLYTHRPEIASPKILVDNQHNSCYSACTTTARERKGDEKMRKVTTKHGHEWVLPETVGEFQNAGVNLDELCQMAVVISCR